MKAKKDKCYIYMRVSTSMQVEGYSLEAQKERLTKFADFQHMEIVREYCDAGKSGKSITGRPEFTQMLQDVANDRDGVKYILVFKLSRFGRNAADVARRDGPGFFSVSRQASELRAAICRQGQGSGLLRDLGRLHGVR